MPWHHIENPQDPQLDELAKRYDLHPLHIEDCRNRNQRAKVEETPNYLFVVLKPVNRIDDDGTLTFTDLDIFVGRDFCITVEEQRCTASQEALASAGKLANPDRPDQIFYRLFDAIVDSYLPAIDHVDEDIDDLEDVVVNRPSPNALQDIFDLKRSLVDLRRTLVNTRDVCIQVQREQGSLISPELGPFFRDIYDHIARNLDSVETHRDLLTGALDVYLSSVANRTNEVMKVLTVMSTIALPAIVISGIYGMNIKNIPFVDSSYAVWIVLGSMALTTLGLLWLLKRFGWF
jgi:magnesium transporter